MSDWWPNSKCCLSANICILMIVWSLCLTSIPTINMPYTEQAQVVPLFFRARTQLGSGSNKTILKAKTHFFWIHGYEWPMPHAVRPLDGRSNFFQRRAGSGTVLKWYSVDSAPPPRHTPLLNRKEVCAPGGSEPILQKNPVQYFWSRSARDLEILTSISRSLCERLSLRVVTCIKFSWSLYFFEQ